MRYLRSNDAQKTCAADIAFKLAQGQDVPNAPQVKRRRKNTHRCGSFRCSSIRNPPPRKGASSGSQQEYLRHELLEPAPGRPIHAHQRLAVLVDELNMYWSAKSMYQKKVDDDALLAKMVSACELIRATAYIIDAGAHGRHTLSPTLPALVLKRDKGLEEVPDGTAKGDWDMGIAIDAISMADRVDVVALASVMATSADPVRHRKRAACAWKCMLSPGTISETYRDENQPAGFRCTTLFVKQAR